MRPRYKPYNILLVIVSMIVFGVVLTKFLMSLEGYGEQYRAERDAGKPVMITEYKKDSTYDSKENRYIREQKERIQNLSSAMERFNGLMAAQDRKNPDWVENITKVLVDMEVEARRIGNAEVPWVFRRCHEKYVRDGVGYLLKALELIPKALNNPMDRMSMKMAREYVERFSQATGVFVKEVNEIVSK